MCVNPQKIKVHDNYKKFRAVLVHAYNKHQLVPCGKCYQCRELKIEEWQIRWSEQLKTSVDNSSYMLTLTYSPENLPHRITPDGELVSTLNYSDVQKFFKRLRKRQDKILKSQNLAPLKITYHGCGEYGKRFTKRPHYHILITNLIIDPDEIQKIWGLGSVHVGTDVNGNTVKYVLKYTLKNSLQNIKKVKIYQSEKIIVKVPAYQSEEKYHAIYQKLGVIYHYPESKEILIEKDKLKLYEINDKNQENEYRVSEKSFCSKGIGKNFITPEIIDLYRSNPALNYAFFNPKKNEYKQKPLPRYYKEIIFNPKLRDTNGKLVKNDHGKYVPKYNPLAPEYENTPRFKKQLISFNNQQKRIQQVIQEIQRLGFTEFHRVQSVNRELNQKIYKSSMQRWQDLQDDKNYKLGIADVI